MQAAIGDQLHVHGNIVGHPDRAGEIVEVRGAGGKPPYLVRFDDGHTGLVFPGPDAIIEHPHTKGKKGLGERLSSPANRYPPHLLRTMRAHAAGGSYPLAPVLTARTAESMICSSRLLWAPCQYTWPQLQQRENVW